MKGHLGELWLCFALKEEEEEEEKGTGKEAEYE